MAVRSVRADVRVCCSVLRDGCSWAASHRPSHRQPMLCRTRKGRGALLRHLAGDAGHARVCFCRRRACGRVPVRCPPARHQPPPGGRAAWRGGRASESLRPGCPSPHSDLGCGRLRPNPDLRSPPPRAAPVGPSLAGSWRAPVAGFRPFWEERESDEEYRVLTVGSQGPCRGAGGTVRGPVWWPDAGRRLSPAPAAQAAR